MRKGLFHTLHRLVKYGWLALLLGAFVLLAYQVWNYKPLRLWAKILRHNRWEAHEFAGELTGRAVRVLAGDNFQLKEPGGLLYGVQLTGVRAPQYIPNRSTRAERELAEFSREFLSRLVLSNEVLVKVTLAKPGSALGVVFVGETNVNAEVVARGFGVTREKWIENLPLTVQYELLRASREAKERGRGLWAPEFANADGGNLLPRIDRNEPE